MAELLHYDVESDSLAKTPESERKIETQEVVSETKKRLSELRQNILQGAEKKNDPSTPEGKYLKLNKIFADEYANSVKEKRKPKYKIENEDKKNPLNNIGKASVMEVDRGGKKYRLEANPEDKQKYVAETIVDGKKITMSVEYTVDGEYKVITTEKIGNGYTSYKGGTANAKANQYFKGLF